MTKMTEHTLDTIHAHNLITHNNEMTQTSSFYLLLLSAAHFVTDTHLRANGLCQGLGHPPEPLHYDLQVLLLIHHLRWT